LKIGPKVRD